MARPFDARSLIGRTFGSVLDEIAPWDGTFGFRDGGPITAAAITGGGGPPLSEEEIRTNVEIRRHIALIVVALCERAAELVTIDGTAVPLWVWLSGRWTFYRDGRGVERLQALTATGEKVEYFNPRFAAVVQPAAERTGTAGRPSKSWHLIEAECRRRYNESERHAGAAGESPTAWADVLLPWLHEAYPTAPAPTRKTACNNLSKLLRKLKKAEPEIGA